MASSYDIKVDNLGPLTTVFTGPASCLATTTLKPPGTNAYYVAAFWDDVPACYPQGTRSYNFHTLPQYFSPGICPSGWSPVTSVGGDWPTTASGYSIYALPSSITAWLCCPSGFSEGFQALSASTAWYYTYDCQSVLRRGQHMTNLWVSGSPVGSVEAMVTITSSVFVDAKGIMIMWESTDTAVLEWWAIASPAKSVSAITTSTSSTISTSATSSTTSAISITLTTSTSATTSTELPSSTSGTSASSSSQLSSTSTSSTSSIVYITTVITSVNVISAGTSASQSSSITSAPDSGGLSTGAKAGIGVSIPLVALAIIFSAFFFFKRRRRYYPRTSQPENSYSTPSGFPEMSTNANTHEMGTRFNAHELAGS